MSIYEPLATPAQLIEFARNVAIRAEREPQARHHLARVAFYWTHTAMTAAHYVGGPDLGHAMRLLLDAEDVTDLPAAEDALRLAELHLDIARAHIKCA
ncbi:fermentation-respiration switch protein FrsA (DUF1100 family) [Crossiella equi]|uniref:Fermentation-respiration switch protein FrsA (DUF1100 family) n=1 Tax=Crossiella equi TaxID=130796 RepID=A0ABS5ABR1_9PSEU|nr:hypothetical protein [Crossiella equi]MBP2474016.1 fermentation-respiration switch protein FrsA (DUF1100 family) [Crossiella equi]